MGVARNKNTRGDKKTAKGRITELGLYHHLWGSFFNSQMSFGCVGCCFTIAIIRGPINLAGQRMTN